MLPNKRLQLSGHRSPLRVVVACWRQPKRRGVPVSAVSGS
jgi:hypothetical protein